MAQGIMPSIGASNTASQLWSLIGKCGYHPSTSDGVRNQTMAREFGERIDAFMYGNLLKDRYADRPWSSLKMILFLDSKSRKKEAWDREEVIHNWYVNELTLVVACFFLFNGYYWAHVTKVLEKLKNELVWLLREHGYKLDTEHALNCPHQDWERHSMWKIVRISNELSQESAPDTEEVLRLIPSCEECPIRTMAAQ